jgi:hypothetical protein
MFGRWSQAKEDAKTVGIGYGLMILGAIAPEGGGFADDAAREAAYLYRGIHAGHPAMEAAMAGRAVPGNIRGVVTAAEHNVGAVSAHSPFTSWTTDLSVARRYAGDNGVILRVPAGAPPPGATWSWEWSPDIFHESEVLLRGVRENCTVMLCVRWAMSEKQRLADALKRQVGTTAWAAAALSAIDDPQVIFAGNRNSPASNTAGGLLRIYQLKLDHCREQGIAAHGIAELIESLRGRTQNEVIEVQPFIGPQSSVAAFWDTAGNLVGCVTVLGRDTESARQNLEFALGKK